MKILHIIDETYFKTHDRIISELLLALYFQGIEQKVYTSFGADLGCVTAGKFPVEYWRVKRSGKIRTFANRVRTMFLMSSFHPDIVIKWGVNARLIGWGAGGIQISYINEKESLVNFENTDYIMTNSDEVLAFVKSHGFSGQRSFVLPPIIFDYEQQSTGGVHVIGDGNEKKLKHSLERRDFFIPEKAKIIYVASTFRRSIGFENAFEALGSVSERYFFIAGNGPDKEYVEDLALRYNVKARSRFVSKVSDIQNILKMVEVAFLPFNDAQIQKYILDAMIAKVPVVTIKTSVTEEFIYDGKTGFFVPVRDMYLIKKKIKEVLNISEEERQKIVDAGYDVAKNYLASRVIVNYVQMFRELLRRYDSRRNLLN